MKFIKLIFCFLTVIFCFNIANAQTWRPSAGHTQIPIWPAGKMPDALSSSPPETSIISTHHLVAGKTWTEILNVSKPTMTLYYPKKNDTHAVVIVFPGGGFNGLAIDLEGT